MWLKRRSGCASERGRRRSSALRQPRKASAPKRRTFKESKPILVFVANAARMLSIGRTAAWELVRKQKIKSVKIGRMRRVPIAAIQDYIDRLMDEDAA